MLAPPLPWVNPRHRILSKWLLGRRVLPRRRVIRRFLPRRFGWPWFFDRVWWFQHGRTSLQTFVKALIFGHTVGWAIVLSSTWSQLFPRRYSFTTIFISSALIRGLEQEQCRKQFACVPRGASVRREALPCAGFANSYKPFLAKSFRRACSSDDRKHGWNVPRETVCPPPFIGIPSCRRRHGSEKPLPTTGKHSSHRLGLSLAFQQPQRPMTWTGRREDDPH